MLHFVDRIPPDGIGVAKVQLAVCFHTTLSDKPTASANLKARIIDRLFREIGRLQRERREIHVIFVNVAS